METILITGGTGLVGQKLTDLLTKNGFKVNILTRSPEKKNEFKWDINKKYIDDKAFKNATYIIHLAGAGIADERWSDKRKKVIIDSRVESTNLLLNKVKELNIPLKKFISASATGFYGAITVDKIFTEKDASADDFLGTVCQKWEDAAHEFEQINIPVAILRTGIVLSEKGGALEKMRTPIISPLGSGKQYIPWIHINDLCEMYLFAIKEESFIGAFNAVAHDSHTSKTFSKTLAKSVGRFFLPIGVPGFLMKLIFGEMAKILLEGSRVSSEKALKTDFEFQFLNLKSALNNLFK